MSRKKRRFVATYHAGTDPAHPSYACGTGLNRPTRRMYLSTLGYERLTVVAHRRAWLVHPGEKRKGDRTVLLFYVPERPEGS